MSFPRREAGTMGLGGAGFRGWIPVDMENLNWICIVCSSESSHSTHFLLTQTCHAKESVGHFATEELPIFGATKENGRFQPSENEMGESKAIWSCFWTKHIAMATPCFLRRLFLLKNVISAHNSIAGSVPTLSRIEKNINKESQRRAASQISFAQRCGWF